MTRTATPPGRLGWLLVIALTATSSVALSGCQPGGNQAGPGKRSQELALTPQEELNLGRQAYKEFQYKNREHIIKQGPQVDQVKRVGDKIVKAALIKPLQKEINLRFNPAFYEWEYTVFQTKDINAFCMPGGKIAVFTGLLAILPGPDQHKKDAQLAAVMAHEVSHALAHHTSERLARKGVLPKGGQEDPQQRNQIMDILAGLSGLAHDRAQESEADHIGLFLMTFAGYDPGEAVVFWETMRKAMASHSHPPEILSDHPSDEQRIAQMKKWEPMARAAKQAYDTGKIVHD
jgi:predicted Zn-dependent protease